MEIEARVLMEEGLRWVEYEIASEVSADGYVIPSHPGIPTSHWGEKTDKRYIRVKEYLPYQQD